MELIWQFIPYAVPLRRPILMAAGVWQERCGWFVTCAGGGFQGFGEIAPLPGWGSETRADALETLRLWPGRTAVPSQVDDIQAVLAATGVSPSARPAVYAGLELALLDWLGRRLNVSVAALLAGASRNCHPVCEVAALIGAVAPNLAAQQAKVALEEGFRTLKIKLNGQDDWARVAAVRAQGGGEVALRLDVNGLWSDASGARAALLPFAELHPEFIEQPLPAEDIAGLGRLASELPFPVAADESLGVLGSCQALLEAQVPVWVCKPMAMGGVLAALAWRQRAELRGVRLVWSSVMDLGIASAGVLHLAASDAVASAVGLGTTDVFDPAWVVPEMQPTRGQLRVPSVPGLGIQGLPVAAAGAAGGVT